ncbi:MAG: hypothetical protein DRP85_07090 [Candidatus Makaraimicrobium thalassicum]|nr:MAG: hypothetical protein DRP85_07090 [Candidatus Omnitrophota bacterium]
MEKREYSDDVINLREYLEVIARRKWTVVSVFFVCVVSSAILTLSMPETYQTKAIIRNGSFEYIDEQKSILNKQIVSMAEARIIIKSPGFLSPVLKKTDLKDFSRGSIKIEPVADTSFFILTVTMSDKNKIYPFTKEIINAYFAYARKQSAKYSRAFPSLVLTKEFETIEPPLRPDRPVKPNKRLNIAVSAVLGLLLGVLAAFVGGYFEKNKTC